MCEKIVTFYGINGYENQNATPFIRTANGFLSSVWVQKDDRRINAKSLLGVLALNILPGSTIKICAEGPDEQKAIDSLVSLIKQRVLHESELSASCFKPECEREEFC